MRDEFELTAREREVLRLVGEGLSNKQIASELGVSTHTIKSHLTSAVRRMGATWRITRAQLAVRVARGELLR
jgi:DNA-binding NarL/FixJ family response regulator